MTRVLEEGSKVDAFVLSFGHSGTPSFFVCEVVDQVTVLGLKGGRLFTVDAFVGEARQQVSEFVGAPLPEEVRDALLHLSLHLRPAHTPSAAATEQKHAIALPKPLHTQEILFPTSPSTCAQPSTHTTNCCY